MSFGILSAMLKIYRMLLLLLCTAYHILWFFATSGNNLSNLTKMTLVWKTFRNTRRIPTASTFVEHLIMASYILRIPKEMQGVIVECGCWKGGSTANLSLVAGIVRRKLFVFDSFEGLPEPSEEDRVHLLPLLREKHIYSKGSWKGELSEVVDNVRRYGCVEACEFIKGYFDQTLPLFDYPVVFAFIDVDLEESVKTCLKYLWPKLLEGCYLFTHEAQHLEISKIFFDKEFWTQYLNQEPPTLIGAGTGLGLFPVREVGFGSPLAFTVKGAADLGFRESVQQGKPSGKAGRKS